MKEESSENSVSASGNLNAESLADISAPDTEYFVLPASFSISAGLKRIAQLTDPLPEEFTRLVATFEVALTRTNKAASLPYRLAWLGVLDTRKQGILQRATILALNQLDPFKDDLESAVPPLRDQIAKAEFLELSARTRGAKSPIVRRSWPYNTRPL